MLAIVAAIAAGCSEDADVAPPSSKTTEMQLRTELGIPPTAQRVLILSQSSHLDWDWLRTFDDYFQGSVDGIFTDALQLLTQYHTAPAHYFYSIAEIGYLQRFVAVHPELLDALRQVGHDLRIVGGGITSPDDLLPSGEAFIRDYLLGKTWVDGTLGLPIRQAWLPDDFGHDAQLPIVLEAMGLQGVGFARVPGVDTSTRFFSSHPSPDSLAAELLSDGIDFVWEAGDGSQALAHWMPASYCQGDPPLGHQLATTDDVRRLLTTNAPVSPTPYIFVPIGCDFAPPKANLLDLVRAWNAQEFESSGVWAVAATFDHYEQLVDAHRNTLHTRHFDPTPYWTGFYASRPLLKGLHLRATQALLGAEIFGAIADAAWRDDDSTWLERVRARSAAIDAGWAILVPGNHHDFITGTAVDSVYEGEQIPRLQDALAHGEAEHTRALTEIATAISPLHTGEHTVVVFNQLGFARQGVAEVPGPADNLPAGSTVQRSADGGTLLVAQVPSLGYVTGEGAATLLPAHYVSLTASSDGTIVVIENAMLRATIRSDAGWSLTSVIDKEAGRETIAAGEAANALRVYRDDGGLYRFGDEMAGCRLTPEDGVVERAAGAATVLEEGPLRARLATRVTIAGQVFEKEYLLVADEPFLRLRATGVAPAGTSVFVSMPLAGPVDDVAYGTPYHWDHKAPARAGSLTFEATHAFLVPSSQGSPLAAVFHAGVPAWAVQPDGHVIGALWRNAQLERCDIYGPSGGDAEEHTVEYALRVASGLTGPERGAQLREALAFQTPLQAIVGTPSGTLSRSFSLASASPDTAMLTAAKAGSAHPETLVLRLYQPTNASLDVNVRTEARRRFPQGWQLDVQGRTALESELPATAVARLGLSGSSEAFGFVAARALTTITVGKDVR